MASNTDHRSFYRLRDHISKVNQALGDADEDLSNQVIDRLCTKLQSSEIQDAESMIKEFDAIKSKRKEIRRQIKRKYTKLVKQVGYAVLCSALGLKLIAFVFIGPIEGT